jgi:hypothetical protein
VAPFPLEQLVGHQPPEGHLIQSGRRHGLTEYAARHQMGSSEGLALEKNEKVRLA